MRKVMISAAVLLGACAQPTWVAMRDGVAPAEQARATCRFEAEKAVPTFDMRQSAFAVAFGQAEVFDRCMTAQGYRRG